MSHLLRVSGVASLRRHMSFLRVKELKSSWSMTRDTALVCSVRSLLERLCSPATIWVVIQ